MDDVLSRLSDDKLQITIKALERTKNQIILTMNSHICID